MIIGITVCVNYADFLKVTLPNNSSLVDMKIVTSSDDEETKKISKANGITPYISDSYKENGATFNKGKMINIIIPND